MTICIGAICNGGKHIVIATDRMFTSPAPVSLEFETDEPKIEVFADGIVVLSAGNTAYVSEMLDLAKTKLKGNNRPSVDEVTTALREAFEKVRVQKAEEQIVIPMLGNDFMAFRNRGGTLPAYLQAQPGVYQNLVAMATQFNIGVELLVAGIDESGAHLAAIGNPGTSASLDKVGFGAVGSGAIHAITTLELSGQSRSRSMMETLYVVYQAKEASQVAPGVGKETDLAVINADRTIKKCEPGILEALEQIRAADRKRVLPNLETVKKAYGA